VAFSLCRSYGNNKSGEAHDNTGVCCSALYMYEPESDTGEGEAPAEATTLRMNQ